MTDGGAERGSTWWQLVEEHVEKHEHDGERERAERDAELPDPWAGAVPDPAGLTDEQRALLEGLDDQPSVARLLDHRDEHDDEADDGDDQPPSPRLAGPRA